MSRTGVAYAGTFNPLVVGSSPTRPIVAGQVCTAPFAVQTLLFPSENGQGVSGVSSPPDARPRATEEPCHLERRRAGYHGQPGVRAPERSIACRTSGVQVR